MTKMANKNLFAALALSASLLSSPTMAEMAPASQNLTFNIYAGGIEALNADYTIRNLPNKNSEIAIDVTTDGFIGKLFPWAGVYKTVGHFDGDFFVPEEHSSISDWKGKPKIKKIDFENGEAISYSEEKSGDKEIDNDLSPAMTDNAVDMLSALMILFRQVETKDTCNTAATVFDGKRKFNIQLTNPANAAIEPSGYSAYTGPALKCTLTVVPLEGFSERDQEKGWMAVQNHTAKRGKLPEIWLAELGADKTLTPVRMEISSAYGNVVAHLSDYKAD